MTLPKAQSARAAFWRGYDVLYVFAAILTLLFSALPASAQKAADHNPARVARNARFHPAVAEHGMVAAQEKLAADVGARILQEGGNAIDAAVATGFAMAVTHPQAGNLGGGGFMVIQLGGDKGAGKAVAIDYREMAPAAASRDMFLDAQGEMDIEKARYSRASAGVPGTVAGLLYALEKYGTMPRARVLAPAIKLAEEGFPVPRGLAYALEKKHERFAKDSSSLKFFEHPGGRPYRPGEILRQPDLAKTLRTIAERGAAGFYSGWVAEAIATEMRYGGLITAADLKAYRVVEREPVRGTYRGYEIISMPPPSSGGTHLIEMLNILEGYDLRPLGHNSAAYIHWLAEAMRRAYADRAKHMGDPDFYPVPVAMLTSKSYAAHLRKGISLTRAAKSADIHAGQPQHEGRQTTHFSVMDDQGNAVANTYTLNFAFGSGYSVDGAGFLLNNEMDDFSAKPGAANAYGLVGGDANAIAPGKPAIPRHARRCGQQRGEHGRFVLSWRGLWVLANGEDMPSGQTGQRFEGETGSTAAAQQPVPTITPEQQEALAIGGGNAEGLTQAVLALFSAASLERRAAPVWQFRNGEH